MQSARRLLLAGALAVFAAPVFAQAFPTHPIRIIIGFPPGGAIDVIARVMAPRMSASMGQQVVIENKPGAGGIIGAQTVARADPDGYTLMMGTMGVFSITPVLMKLPFDMERDFTPVTLVASSGFVIYVNPSLPIHNVSELIAYAKAHPKGVNFSSSGNGGLPHMAGELFNSTAGVQMVHVPYKGSSPSINDVVAGQVQLTFESTAIGLPFVKAGRLRAIATTGDKRLASMPDVPSASETLPGFSVTNWFGLAAPAGTPPAVVERLQSEVSKALRQPDVQAQLQALGVDPVGDTPAQFGAFMKSETQRWGRVVKEANIKIE
jgi:tripartite-type tricarboxylate transporter receptor subunit TctC